MLGTILLEQTVGIPEEKLNKCTQNLQVFHNFLQITDHKLVRASK